MGRTAVADEYLQSYIKNLAEKEAFCIGLILGQPADNKDIIIHFARTPPNPTMKKIDKIRKSSGSHASSIKIEEISEFWIADHAKHATRMLPGGMYVLGIFIISSEDLLTPFHAKFRSIAAQINRLLVSNLFLYGIPEDSEKLFLNYCTTTQTFTCKNYNVITSAVKTVDFKFLHKPMKWCRLHCSYDMNETFPICEGRYDWTLKQHLQAILETINNTLKTVTLLYDFEKKNNDDILELFGKKNLTSSKINAKDNFELNAVEVTLLLPYHKRLPDTEVEIKACGGFIKIIGDLTSRLWLYPKMTVADASKAVIQDIIRSLAARLEMHWDSLIDEGSGSTEDTSTIHEPPRRVLITLPCNKVMLSDYLFPGEGANDSFISLSELLDITLQDKKCIFEIEQQADFAEICPPVEPIPEDSEENLQLASASDSSKFMYMVGFSVALFVLIMSLIIHFLKAYTHVKMHNI